MTTKVIKKSDSSFVMQTIMPDGWSPDSTVTISIYDPTDGTAIVDGAATTARFSDTLSTAATAGSYAVVLTTGGAVTDSMNIAVGSDAQGYEQYVVDRYTASSKTVEIVRSLDEDLDNGSNFYEIDLRYTLDASVSGFEDLKKVKVVWSPNGDELPLTELWEIQTEQSQVQGLHNEFRIAYKEIENDMESEEFVRYETRARQSLKLYCESRLINFDKYVDSDLIRELMLTEIALLAGELPLSQEKYDRLQAKRDNKLTELLNLSKWTDTNEDNVETEDETQPGQDFTIQRGF